jgi:hypothetical protein
MVEVAELEAEAVPAVGGRSPALSASLLVGALTVLSLLLPANPVCQATIIVGLVLLLGSPALRALGLRRVPLGVRIVVTSCTGLLVAFILGALVGWLLPHMGVTRPLDGSTSKVIWAVVVVAATLVSVASRDSVGVVFDGVTRRDVAWAAALAVPPLVALVGVGRLNANGSPVFALGSGFLALAMVLAAIALPASPRLPPRVLLLMSGLVTAAWEGPMRGGFLFGGDLQHEYFVGSLAIRQGVFPLHGYHDSYAGMLPLTVWPAMLHSVSGLSLRATLALLPSLVLALCVLATWSTIREWVDERTAAVLCSLLLLGSASMIREMPAVTRQCYALLFFTLLVMAVSSRRLPIRAARVLAALSGLGMAVTHYNSAYIAAACAIGGWFLCLLLQRRRADVVLTTPVTACVVGAAALWGAFVAKTGNSFSEVADSIRREGYRFLPSGGSVFTRWIRGANISKLVNARLVRIEDLAYRRGIYARMSVDPHALSVHLIDVRSPRSVGVPVIGFAIGVIGPLVAELLLLAALGSVVACLWRIRADRKVAALAGMAVVGAVIAAISRSSETLAVQFGPTRIQLQMYLLFVVTMAITVTMLPSRERLAANARRWALVVVAGCAGVAVITSMQLSTVFQRGAQLTAYYARTGDQVERLPTPPDLVAGTWLAVHRPTKLIQSDWGGQYVLDAYGFSTRAHYIRSIDPIITDNGAWLLATKANMVLGVARGGDYSETGLYRFPRAYFESTRSVVYVSPNDVVFGPDPSRGHMYHPRGSIP